MVDLVKAPLFVPGTQPELVHKAIQSGADAVIVDLEDAVADCDKEVARDKLCEAAGYGANIVRINARGTRWHDSDLSALADHPAIAVMLPKADEPKAVADLIGRLDGRPVIALIESAKGLQQAGAIAAVPGVRRLAFGSVDFCADLGCAHEREILLPVRSALVIASRIAGIEPPLDGVTLQWKDVGAVFDDALNARKLGMTGKLCVHPRQVSEVRRAFQPTETEFDWAQRVLAAGEGAVAVDGEMVDEPVRIRARGLLSRSNG